MQSSDKVADDDEEEGKNQAFLTLFGVTKWQLNKLTQSDLSA